MTKQRIGLNILAAVLVSAAVHTAIAGSLWGAFSDQALVCGALSVAWVCIGLYQRAPKASSTPPAAKR